MKKIICVSMAFFLALCAVLGGCAPAFEKAPSEFEDIKWVTPDYSFRFNPSDDCKGNYNYGDNKYKIRVEFDNSRFSVIDTEKDKELFYGDWIYEDKDYLFMSNIVYNTGEYEELKSNFSEFYRLHQEPIK